MTQAQAASLPGKPLLDKSTSLKLKSSFRRKIPLMSRCKASRRAHARPATRPQRVSQSLVVEAAPAGQPAPGLRVSLAGRTFYLTDLALVAFALGWLTFIMLSTRSAQLIASDDAFISFPYARNLARGYGLVFNPGEHFPKQGFEDFSLLVQRPARPR